MNRPMLISVAAVCLLLPACGGSTSDDDDTPTASESSTPSPTAATFPSGGVIAIVSTVASDYSAGTLSQLDPLTGTSHNDVADVTSDTVVVEGGGLLFVLARQFSGDDSVTVYDPVSLEQIGEVEVPGNGNPHDVVVLGGKGYISLYNGAEVRVFDVSDLSVVESIGLADWADSDGDANASSLVISDGKVYVGLQRVDYNAGFVPVAPGYVLEIDPTTDTVSRAIELIGTNVGTLYAEGGSIVAATGGAWSEGDGGIERLNLETGATEGYIVEETDHGAEIHSFAVAGGMGWFVKAGAPYAFDLDTGAPRTVPASANVAGLTGMWGHGANLWLAAGSAVSMLDVSGGASAPLLLDGAVVSAHNVYSFALVDVQ